MHDDGRSSKGDKVVVTTVVLFEVRKQKLSGVQENRTHGKESMHAALNI